MTRFKATLKMLRPGDRFWDKRVACYKRINAIALVDKLWEISVDGRDTPYYFQNITDVVEIDKRTARRVYGKAI